ncbi:MAG: MmgE/PrpD family protein [Dongiaceae bacterium]
MTTSPGLTSRFAEGLHALGRGVPLAEHHRAAARLLIMDGLAVAVAGSGEPGPSLLRRTFAGPAGACTLIGAEGRADPVAAARINGAAMHVLDFEAMWSPPNHATSTTLPALLAAAEAKGADGAAVLAGYVAGVEAQCRLRRASQVIEPRAFNFHPPGLVGPIGAAVAAGHLLGLSPLQLRHAIGVAASCCGSLLANVGSMTKALHCGNAAASGLMAALLAEGGFTANPDVLEAPHGYAGNLVETLDEADLTAVGRPLMLEDPGFAFKLFPCQYGTHFAVTAALELAPQLGDPARITGVELVTPEMDYIDRPRPRTGLEGKFSFQYTAAAALLDGKVTIASFADARLARPDMQRLLGLIELRQDPALPASFEAMEVRIVVHRQGLPPLEAVCPAPRGYLRKGAPVGAAEIEAKARDCLATRLPPATVEAVVDGARRIDMLSAAELAALIKLTVPSPADSMGWSDRSPPVRQNGPAPTH